MGVAQGMYKLAWLQTCDLCHHEEQQGIRGDVERHPEEEVGRALVELERQLSVGDKELVETMAGRQSHLVNLCHIPGADNEAAAVRVGANLLDDIHKLVNMTAVVVIPGTPLVAIDRTQFAGLVITPFVPDMDIFLLEHLLVGRTTDEPQEFLEDATGKDFLGGYQGESLTQVEAHLITKDTLGKTELGAPQPETPRVWTNFTR